jgi:hypothetical protein
MSIVQNIETLPQQRGGNYEVARFNALRHGILSQHTVLPWEDGEEYRALLEALLAEHQPRGPTEEHLVEELAGIIWRKRRLRLGESAAHHRALKHACDPYQKTAEAALINVAGDVEGFPFGEHRRPGYSVGLTCGGARRAARSSAMICCRHSMPSLVKAVTPSSPTP